MQIRPPNDTWLSAATSTMNSTTSTARAANSASRNQYPGRGGAQRLLGHFFSLRIGFHEYIILISLPSGSIQVPRSWGPRHRTRALARTRPRPCRAACLSPHSARALQQPGADRPRDGADWAPRV